MLTSTTQGTGATHNHVQLNVGLFQATLVLISEYNITDNFQHIVN